MKRLVVVLVFPDDDMSVIFPLLRHLVFALVSRLFKLLIVEIHD